MKQNELEIWYHASEFSIFFCSPTYHQFNSTQLNCKWNVSENYKYTHTHANNNNSSIICPQVMCFYISKCFSLFCTMKMNIKKCKNNCVYSIDNVHRVHMWERYYRSNCKKAALIIEALAANLCHKIDMFTVLGDSQNANNCEMWRLYISHWNMQTCLTNAYWIH